LMKGLLRKFLATEIQDVLDAAREEDAQDNEDDKPSALPDDGIRNEALDKLFDTSLEEHANYLRAIEELKAQLGRLLAYLEENAKARLPMFIFVDELDRCRPNYAIELLEGLKHLFDVRGLCFCVSTN